MLGRLTAAAIRRVGCVHQFSTTPARLFRRSLFGRIPAFNRRDEPERPSPLQHLLDRNRSWAKRTTAEHPEFYTSQAKTQHPEYLWIGCSDSRVPANQVVDLPPGNVFVHRNIANVVSHSDFNCLSVVEYAVEILKVKHIIVCGHYGCGGVAAALQDRRLGLIDNWLRHIRDVREKHKTKLEQRILLSDERRMAMLCELNVIEQVQNVVATTIVQEAWDRGHELTVHGWIYNMSDGRIKDLGVSVKKQEEVSEVYRTVMTMEEVEVNVDDENPGDAAGKGTTSASS